MKTHTATPEQKAKAKARRERFAGLVKQISAMNAEERAALSAKMLTVTCDGHLLSATNQILIAYQREGCTIVGGFAQWIKQGRVVSKGQTGLMIWVPVPTKRENGEENTESNDRPGFIPGTVFDISQTEPLQVPQE